MNDGNDSPRETKPSLESRLRGMIWGQFVGDAACLGTHWIYNLSELQAAYPNGIHGFEVPREGHFHAGKQRGDQTHYGDAALILLESIAAKGALDVTDYGSRFVEFAGSYTGYIDHATRGTLEAYESWKEGRPGDAFSFQEGADDDQLANASSLAPLVAVYFGEESLLGLVERATRVRQNNERAVAYMKGHARILVELLEGRDIHSSLHRVEEMVVYDGEMGTEVKRKIAAAFSLLGTNTTSATQQLGQSCPLISSFPSSVHSLLRSFENFPETILHIAKAGGDSAGRAAMTGAWLGAHLGVDAIPDDWIERLNAQDRIAAAIDRIVKARLDE